MTRIIQRNEEEARVAKDLQPSFSSATEADTEWKPYSPHEGRAGKVFRKAMAIAEHIGMTKAERYELALLVPTVDKDGKGSWKTLTDAEMETVLTMLEGFVYIESMLLIRGDSE